MTDGQEQWNEVSGGTLYKWDVPKQLQGIFKGEIPSDSKYNQPKFAVDTPGAEGPETVEFFAPAILARLLRSSQVKTGEEILIEYTGNQTKTSGGRMAKEFLVKVR
jgi:hypothetical protein